MRIGVALAAATIAAFVACPAFAEGEASSHTTPQQQTLSQGELDALVAPIALYPDALLAQVLMASTYPLEVVQADRWAKANKSLKGDKLDEALAKQDWDASIKALVATPTVLAMLNDDLDWTEKLGDAVLAQQADVMDAIQRLRAKAEANSKLARPGAITDEELEREKGGSGLRYSFDMKSGGAVYEVGVDAQTGKVLENKKEGPHPD